MKYVIEFRYPEFEVPVYAGRVSEGLGWATTKETALTFDSEDDAWRLAIGGYGAQAGLYAKVVELGVTV